MPRRVRGFTQYEPDVEFHTPREWPKCAITGCENQSSRIVEQFTQASPKSKRKKAPGSYRCLDHTSRWDVVVANRLAGDPLP